MATASDTARALVAEFILRIARDARLGTYADDAGAALREHADAAAPVLQLIADLEQANATLWSNLSKPKPRLIERSLLLHAARTSRVAHHINGDPHNNEPANLAIQPASERPDEELPERADFADDSTGGFRGGARRA